MRNYWIMLSIALVGNISAQEYYEIDPVKIDDRYDHFMPVILGDQIVFSSTNSEDVVIKYTDRGTKKTPSSLYVATIEDGDLQGNAKPLAHNIRTSLHQGPATFSEDGLTMIFTRNLHVDRWIGNDRKDRNKLGLFITEKINGEWSDPIPFKYNDEGHNVGHPTLSTDGKYLYFVSDMPGSFGGTDLYVCEVKNGEWGRPKNLGKNINSRSNEMFPTILPNNMIYFSSDRNGGLGGLDIYVSQLNGSNWSSPSALTDPLNSIADDMGFAPIKSGRTGYLSSNRNGKDEILYFKRTIPLFKNCAPQVENSYCYVFEEEGTLSTDSLPLVYQWDLGDGTTIFGTEAEHCYAGPGKYIVKLNIIDTLTKSIFFNEASYVLEIEDTEQPYISVEGPLYSRHLLSFSANNSNISNNVIAEYHWDLADSVDIMGDIVTKRFHGSGDKIIKLDVIFEPDSSGRITHQCVTRRLTLLEPKQLVDISDETIVVEYTDAEGIIHKFTYQELPYDLFDISVKDGDDVFFTIELLASKDRISTTDPFFDKARAKYRILENYISQDEHFSYSIGNEASLEDVFPIFSDVKAMDYERAVVKAIKVEKVKEIGNPEDMAALKKLNVEDLNNTVLRMSTVYFRSGDHVVDTIFMGALDKLLEIVIAFEKINLEISAYTDDVGPNSFNKLLSERRAGSIVEYLLSQGLEVDRMKAIGYGEDHPIASNEEEEGRRLNRRVEFKLVLNAWLSSE